MFTKQTLRLSLTFSFLAIVVGIIFQLSLYFLKQNIFSNVIFLDFLVPLAFYIPVLYFFKKSQGGELRFWQGFVLGTQFNLPLIMVLPLFFWLLYGYIDPEAFEWSKEHAIAHFEASKADLLLRVSEEAYYEKLDQLREFDITGIAAFKFMEFFILGFVYSLFLSAFFRK